MPRVDAPTGSRSAAASRDSPEASASSDDGAASVGRAEPASLHRPPDRVGRLDRPPLPAARRLDRDERALAAVGERREEDLVVGSRRAPAIGERRRDLDRGQRALERVGSDDDAQTTSPQPASVSVSAALPALEVLRDPDHRRALHVGQLDDLERQPAAAGARQLHRRAELGEQARLAPLLEPLHDRLQDHERHPRQALELLVAVDPPLEVDLAEPIEPGALGDVDEVPDLDRVAGEERDLLEDGPPAGVLARTAAG